MKATARPNTVVSLADHAKVNRSDASKILRPSCGGRAITAKPQTFSAAANPSAWGVDSDNCTEPAAKSARDAPAASHGSTPSSLSRRKVPRINPMIAAAESR